MKRIFVTGASGFVGCRLVESLCTLGLPVSALVRTNANAERLGQLPVTTVPGGMLDLDSFRAAVRGCDTVVHCAVDNRSYDAAGGVAHRLSSKSGTANVLQAALEAGVERVVHLSSVAVYGYAAHPLAATEDGETRYTGDAYCDGKIDAETIALDYHRRQGLPVVVLRPTLVYGPFNSWIPYLASALRERQVVLVDGGTGPCNQLFVDNLVQAILLAAQHPEAPGQVFHVSDAVSVSWRQFLESHARSIPGDWLPLPEVTDRELRIVQVDGQVRARVTPQSPGRSWWGVLGRLWPRRPRSAVVTGDPFDIPAIFQWKTVFSIAKAQSILGYQPKDDFESGMEKTAAWVRHTGI